MSTLQEIELLATITNRAGVTQIEALWLNSVFDRLRALVITEEKKQPPKPKGESDA